MGTNNAKQVQVMGRFLKGLSAYEIAVKNGFEGSEEEWLISLIRGVYVGSGFAPAGTVLQVDNKAAGDTLTVPDVLQTTGNSEEDTMSQKAITEAINEVASKVSISGAVRVFKEVVIEEPVAYAFIPFTEFKNCTNIFVQVYIPTIDEEDYSLGIYRPRLKLALSSAWYNGIVVSPSSQIFKADAVKTKYNAVLYSDGTNVYYATSDIRLQNGCVANWVTGANGDNGIATLNNAFTNSNAGIYFEIEDRTTYQVPVGTVLTAIGV